jgi:hypothetical protein
MKTRVTSMKLLLVGLLASTSVAFAAGGPISYHDGTLVSFSLGISDCTARVQETCDDEYQAQYLIKSEGILYNLTPVTTSSGGFADKVSLAWTRVVSKNSSLYHQTPGTPLLLRDDGKHLFVKVGSHESRYIAIEATDIKDKTATAQADQP